MIRDVRIRKEGRAGRITLTRPEALHALTLPMCEAMIEALTAWREDPDVELVLIEHEGGRGFCAGGDIRALYDSLQGDGVMAERFFFVEYQLDHLLFTYEKPVAAVIDGVVMGGGVGISLPARYRIATGRTTFAMPECGIGLFPDVGASWYLSRMNGEAGLWLALTGARIKGGDLIALGVATHHVAADDLEAIKRRIIERPEEIDDVLDRHAAEAGPAIFLPEHHRFFDRSSVEATLDRLRSDDSDWAAAQARAIETKCPMMLKVALEAQNRARALSDFADDLAMEYGLAVRTIHRPDFSEGVRAVVIDKDNAPRWTPASLEEVGPDMVDTMFEPLPDQQWSPLSR